MIGVRGFGFIIKLQPQGAPFNKKYLSCSEHTCRKSQLQAKIESDWSIPPQKESVPDFLSLLYPFMRITRKDIDYD